MVAAAPLIENLAFVSKRISWLEKSTDPTWEPYEKRSEGKNGTGARAGTTYGRRQAAKAGDD
jgi:hypothetical protein